MILVGYDDKSKAYLCYNPLMQKVVISRDVKFLIKDEISEIYVEEKSLDTESTDEQHQNSEDLDGDMDKTIYYSDSNDEEDINITPLRKSERKGVPPKRLIEEINIVHKEIKELKSYKEDVTGPFKHEWIKAMKEEMKSLENNHTWELSKLLQDKQVISCKWIYKLEHGSDGTLRRFKARLVAQSYSQKYGEDYD